MLKFQHRSLVGQYTGVLRRLWARLFEVQLCSSEQSVSSRSLSPPLRELTGLNIVEKKYKKYFRLWPNMVISFLPSYFISATTIIVFLAFCQVLLNEHGMVWYGMVGLYFSRVILPSISPNLSFHSLILKETRVMGLSAHDRSLSLIRGSARLVK